MRRNAPRLILPFLAALATSPAHAQQPGGDAPPPTVTVVTLHSQDVALTTTLPGRVSASAEAEVRPQVNGIVTERLFEEGRQVKRGDPLFRIDATTYDAAVAQAEAGVAQARATADNARREAERAGALRDRRVTSESSTESAIANRDAAEAAVKVAEAQLLAARIELDRTTIRAELDGEIGLAQTSQGALVTASQANPLAVIRTLDPVHVDVTQSAAELIRWRRDMAAQTTTSGGGEHPGQAVTLRLADGTEYPEKGTLTAAEPYVNETTGVVTLRLSFDNPQRILLPGMYVQAVVQQATAQGVILAPQEGVSRDRRGLPVAMVVNAQNQVESRDLTVLQNLGNDWVVSKGLKDGDRLIVEGLQFIAPGAPVNPQERQAAASGDTPAPQHGGAAPAADAATGQAPSGQAPADEAPAEEAPTGEASSDAAPAASGDTPAQPPQQSEGTAGSDG
ncbi:efflux RND transporter periplasmic adaptor subunit [Paracoccus shanxieyensis]|uniref:Efflux RND transporter periplasmic adaptor subunit n=1 Tax=Paracoccus shanxieyensis TaxID=2675752 RepID=A0A6L6IZ87_9RHOB|nr:efflux RND transporter periplasmic adaptor subunit [Paracoccus shanxieyensis]MTH63904.1 efflux RND transporter periplasmic adaptor subunit [Paracoccus shanxieyensis]MTH86584.1 efflux RND transporter periplasmic adaptor subunit [Paracoccus shanxieyensis]